MLEALTLTVMRLLVTNSRFCYAFVHIFSSIIHSPEPAQ